VGVGLFVGKDVREGVGVRLGRGVTVGRCVTVIVKVAVGVSVTVPVGWGSPDSDLHPMQANNKLNAMSAVSFLMGGAMDGLCITDGSESFDQDPVDTQPVH